MTFRRRESNSTDSFSNDTGSRALRLLFLSCLTDHGGSPSQGCFGALKEVISRSHALVRHLEAGVDVDPSRNHHPRMGLNGLHPSWHNQVFSYLPKWTRWVTTVINKMSPNQTGSDRHFHQALNYPSLCSLDFSSYCDYFIKCTLPTIYPPTKRRCSTY